jgi:hypothetical protein
VLEPIGKTPPDPGGIGYKYRDRNMDADGVLKISYKSGVTGKSKASLKAKGSNIPVGMPAALQGSNTATMQLRASDGVCLSHTMTTVRKDDATSSRSNRDSNEL